MIIEFEDIYIDQVMDIWLKTNINTHTFIQASYWLENYDDVKERLKQATIYIYVIDNEILGFIGLIDNYIAGLFVKSNYQSQQVGLKLLNYVKQIHNRLLLDVYSRNKRALEFYKREGFNIYDKQLSEITNEEELLLSWMK